MSEKKPLKFDRNRFPRPRAHERCHICGERDCDIAGFMGFAASHLRCIQHEARDATVIRESFTAG